MDDLFITLIDKKFPHFPDNTLFVHDIEKINLILDLTKFFLYLGTEKNGKMVMKSPISLHFHVLKIFASYWQVAIISFMDAVWKMKTLT